MGLVYSDTFVAPASNAANATRTSQTVAPVSVVMIIPRAPRLVARIQMWDCAWTDNRYGATVSAVGCRCATCPNAGDDVLEVGSGPRRVATARCAAYRRRVGFLMPTEQRKARGPCIVGSGVGWRLRRSATSRLMPRTASLSSSSTPRSTSPEPRLELLGTYCVPVAKATVPAPSQPRPSVRPTRRLIRRHALPRVARRAAQPPPADRPLLPRARRGPA